MYAYQNLIAPRNVTAGIAESVYIAPFKWFSSIKQPVPPFNVQGDEVIIYETHEFLDDSVGFFKTLLAPEKNSYDAKMVGERGFHSYDHDLKVFIAGSYPEVHEQTQHLYNVPLIALHKDANCPLNLWYQIGTDWLQAYMTIDFSTGATNNGIKGFNGSINFVSKGIQFYAGTIKQINPPYGEYNEDFNDDFNIGG